MIVNIIVGIIVFSVALVLYIEYRKAQLKRKDMIKSAVAYTYYTNDINDMQIAVSSLGILAHDDEMVSIKYTYFEGRPDLINCYTARYYQYLNNNLK